MLSTFRASFAAVATAATMAMAGAYLHRRGFVTDEGKRLLAKVSQQVTIPALLFSKIVYCKQDSSVTKCESVLDMLDGMWMLLFWPLYVVSCGLIIGHFACWISDTPISQKPIVLASCAFANSTGLPITLLTVIHQNFPNTTELGRVDPTLFLSIYLIIYPILQWGVGGWILNCGEEETSSKNNQSQSINEYHLPTIDFANEVTSLLPDVENDSSRNSSLSLNIKLMASRSLQPPVIGALAGIFVAAIAPLRGIFVDLVNRDDDALLEWFFDGIYSIGQAAVPISMIILGINLSKTFGSSYDEKQLLSRKTMASVIFGKMVVMPIIGICSAYFLKKYVWHIPDAIDDAFYLVLMMVFITPTANNVMVMVELGSNVSKEAIARLIGWQYAVAPVILSGSVALIIHAVNEMKQLGI